MRNGPAQGAEDSEVVGRRRDRGLEAVRLRGVASISKMVLRVIIEFTLKERCF